MFLRNCWQYVWLHAARGRLQQIRKMEAAEAERQQRFRQVRGFEFRFNIDAAHQYFWLQIKAQ
jgi:hypothetical protein